jgi:hypothetical protein
MPNVISNALRRVSAAVNGTGNNRRPSSGFATGSGGCCKRDAAGNGGCCKRDAQLSRNRRSELCAYVDRRWCDKIHSDATLSGRNCCSSVLQKPPLRTQQLNARCASESILDTRSDRAQLCICGNAGAITRPNSVGNFGRVPVDARGYLGRSCTNPRAHGVSNAACLVARCYLFRSDAPSVLGDRRAGSRHTSA